MQNDEPGDAMGFTCLLFQSPVTEGCVSIIFSKTQVACVIIPQL